MASIISSASHPLIRRVRELLSDARRREVEGMFVVEGTKIAHEALEEPEKVEQALIASDLIESGRLADLVERLHERSIPCSFFRGAALKAAQDSDAPQGIVLLVRMSARSLDAATGRQRDPLVALAWQIQDPGNLGAILRAAEAAGACSVITVAGGADPYHPRAVRGSAGSVLRLPIVRAADPRAILGELRRLGLSLVAAVPQGGTRYDLANLTGPLAIVVGNEGGGLPGELDPFLDGRVTIPMRGRVESLNVAVSAALLMFESARQREAEKRPRSS